MTSVRIRHQVTLWYGWTRVYKGAPRPPGLPRMVAIRDYGGVPCPQRGPPLSIHAGDVIEVMFADLHSSWWQVRVTRLILV